MAKLASILKTDVMADFDLKGLAQILQSLGRKGDKILAHITPEEAEMLKEEGGSGAINPNTGLPEFDDGFDFGLDVGLPESIGVPEAGGQGAVSPDYEPYGPPASAAPPAAPPAATETPGAGAYATETFGQAPLYGDYTAKPVSDIMAGTTTPMPGAVDLSKFGLGTQVEVPPPPQPLAVKPAGAAPEDLTGEQKGILEKLGISTKDALKLGMGGVGALVAGLQGRAAQQRAQQAAAQTAAIGAPYQAAGQAQMAAAQRGELTPERQQALQAAQAQMAQGIERRGGVGAMQAATQLQTFRNQLLQDQYNYGLKIATLGDQYAANAIRVGLTQDQAVAQAMRGLTGSLGQFAAT